ncbi:MAG: thioesterase family protein [Acidimicrobiales bacterium]|nr:thioesterase family protein [Acidimicrobiales bacterium]
MASSPDPTPVPYRARAWHDGAVVAETTVAVRVDQADGPPALWFPATDVRVGALPDGARWADAPGAGSAAVDGRIALDHDVVRVELVDELDVKRFPTWGDAADLVDVLDVRPDGGTAWVSGARADWRRPVVEASQMLGQCVVAAMRHARGRRVVSSHLAVFRIADARVPVQLTLDELSAGRTFTTLAAQVHQGDRPVAAGTFHLDATAADVVRHAEPAPDVPGPLDCPAYDMAVTGRDLRIVDDAYTGDPDAPVGPPELDTWVRFRDLPADPALHAGLLAQFTGHMSIAAALRPHAGVGQAAAHVTLSTGINAIALSFHADVRADRWLLYHHRSTVAADGMTHSECRVHDEAGALVASFTVDAMVRAMTPTAAGDARTAM